MYYSLHSLSTICNSIIPQASSHICRRKNSIVFFLVCAGSWPCGGLWRSTSNRIQRITEKPLEISHWDALERLKSLLKWPVSASLSLESDNKVTAGKTLKHLTKLVDRLRGMWWRHTRAYRPRVRASVAEVLAAVGPAARRGSVSSVGWAMCVRAQQRPPHGTGSSESGRGDETLSSTRVPRTGLALHTRFTQELLATAKGGEAQCRPLSQGHLLYTMMMSAAVLARGLIGTC